MSCGRGRAIHRSMWQCRNRRAANAPITRRSTEPATPVSSCSCCARNDASMPARTPPAGGVRGGGGGMGWMCVIEVRKCGAHTTAARGSAQPKRTRGQPAQRSARVLQLPNGGGVGACHCSGPHSSVFLVCSGPHSGERTAVVCASAFPRAPLPRGRVYASRMQAARFARTLSRVAPRARAPLAPRRALATVSSEVSGAVQGGRGPRGLGGAKAGRRVAAARCYRMGTVRCPFHTALHCSRRQARVRRVLARPPHRYLPPTGIGR